VALEPAVVEARVAVIAAVSVKAVALAEATG
jgi:hypothetical protein